VNKKLNKRREREGGRGGGREGGGNYSAEQHCVHTKRKERKQIAVRSGEIWQERRNKIYLIVHNCVRNGVRSNLLRSSLFANAYPLQQ